jgi:O-acetyl-ADP-ribose deacetylase (regulator of RNase III)/uncharacterized protein YwgA
MIQVTIGNLLNSKAQTLVNTVNCVGVMGKGIAAEFKSKFPDMYRDYVKRCDRGEVELGKPYVYRSLLEPQILNFPTKGHWKSTSNLDDIIRGLDYLVEHYKGWGITSLAVPPLGCGNGQLEWRVVGPTLYRYLCKLDVPVELYVPHGTPHEELQPDYLNSTQAAEMELNTPEPQWMPPAWVALVEIVRRIENQPKHRPVGRTAFRQIAFVATDLGLPTGLVFEQRRYGPDSTELKSVEKRLANHGLVQERRDGQLIEMKVGPTFDDAYKAYGDELAEWETIIDQTYERFRSIDSADQVEHVATAD